MKFTRSLYVTGLCALLVQSVAQAGYLEDFYEKSQAQVTVNAAGLYQAQSLGLATGGHYQVKVPQKDLPMVGLQAPSLAAGCGGIDIFLGAFSIPSEEEFVSYLRSIGTALPGLAFQLALQTFSPDLNRQVTSFRNMIRDFTKEMQNSCQAAQKIVDATGINAFFQQNVHYAKNALVASGEADDAAQADRMVRRNGEKAIASVPTLKNRNAHIVSAGELNLTWALLDSFDARLSIPRRELMMSLVGTHIYRQVGRGENATLESQTIGGQDYLPALLSPQSSEKIQYAVLRCDETERCLRPHLENVDDVHLAQKVEKVLRSYAQSILARQEHFLYERDLRRIAMMTRFPVLRLTELAAHPRFTHLNDNLLRSYAEIIAYDIVLESLTHLDQRIRKALSHHAATQTNHRQVEHYRSILLRLDTLRRQTSTFETTMATRLAQTMQFQRYLAHLEQSLMRHQAQERSRFLRRTP